MAISPQNNDKTAYYTDKLYGLTGMVYAKPIVLHTRTDTYCPSLGQTPIVPHIQTEIFWHSFPSAISAWNYSFLCLILLSCCLHMQY